MKMRSGISGILRVKNDGPFIERCVRSCIDALDELIIVYNDCSDNSEEEIVRMHRLYPDKIKVYEYPHKLIAHNLTKEEMDYALGLPADSPFLLSSYYNFALSKASYRHAMKIDADQIYFIDDLKEWCDLTRGKVPKYNRSKYALGRVVFEVFRVVRKLSLILKIRLPFPSMFQSNTAFEAYKHYAAISFCRDRAALSLSGLNVFHSDNGKCYVTLGCSHDGMNVLPPFNGENDHLIFRISDQTYYRPFVMEYYQRLHDNNLSLIEEMIHPYTPINIGYFWSHVNSDRERYKGRNNRILVEQKESFVEFDKLLNKKYKWIENRSDKNIFTLYQRLINAFLFKPCRNRLVSNKPTIIDS